MSVKLSEFQEIMQNKLIQFKENNQYLPAINEKINYQYFEISDNLFPPIKHSFLHYAYENGIPFHDYINHVRSSQAFGINLFYPLLISNKGKQCLLRTLNDISNKKHIKITKYAFEYSAELDWLGEWINPNKRQYDYVTASDIFIETELENNKKNVFLIEVKLTEVEFSPCNGYTSKGNDKYTKKYCEKYNDLKNNPDMCYLATKQTRKSPRKYFHYFDIKNEIIKDNGNCPFISNHQCIRNHSLLRALIKEKKYDNGYFILCYHQNNELIKNEWIEYVNLFNNNTKTELLCVTPEDIINNVDDKNYKKYISDRYFIE